MILFFCNIDPNSCELSAYNFILEPVAEADGVRIIRHFVSLHDSSKLRNVSGFKVNKDFIE